MERVPGQTSIRSLILVTFFLLCSAHPSLATTVTLPSDDDMVIGARAILSGKVVAIESNIDPQTNGIYTYITIKVQEVFKGQIAERRIVLKEMGGRVGERASVIFGNPQYKRGERVLLYLDTWADGSLRTYQMFLGKFNIVNDPITGDEMAVRSSPDENTTILKEHLHPHGVTGQSTERQTLRRYIRMVRNRLAATWQRSVQFDSEFYANKPLRAEPVEFASIAGKGDISPNFTFLGPFRFFEPDSGQPVLLTLNPNPGEPAVVLNPADIAAAGGAWSNVAGCSLQVTYSGPLNECYAGTGLPGIHVISNNCDGRNGASPGCANILAWGGVSQTGFQSRTINGTTFGQSTQGFVSMNPYSACNFGNSCNVREILTHEIGHALGLGHSQFQDATMAAFAHFDGRCASIRQDDVNGIVAIYPASGGGGGPLTVLTSSLAGGTVGAAYSQSLSASGGTLPYTWSLVPGLGTLPAGLTLSGSGVISGTPTTAATSNFTVRVTDQPGTTAQKALSIVVSAGGGGGALNSEFVTQNVPTNVQPGQVFLSNLQFRNTGTTTWSGVAYFFASQNPSLNQTWGGNGVNLNGFVAAPGQVLSVDFTATAPTTPGTYNFQWQMYQNGGAGFFGQMSTNVSIQVGNPPPPSNVWDTIGLFRPSGNMFYLKNGNSMGGPDISASFGAPGDIAIAGDWDGNGTVTMGLYRPSSSTFFLRNANTPGFPDVIVSYGDGPGGDKPIVGDWNGDGVWTIGVYRPGSSTFYLRNSNTPGFPDISVSFGAPGDLPVVGDWDGNGTMTIGLFRPSGNVFFLRNTNALGFPDVTVAFGASGDMPIVGDWNGDGTTTIGLFRPSGNYFFLRNSNTTGMPDIMVPYGAPGDLPIVGNWDGQ